MEGAIIKKEQTKTLGISANSCAQRDSARDNARESDGEVDGEVDDEVDDEVDCGPNQAASQVQREHLLQTSLILCRLRPNA